MPIKFACPQCKNVMTVDSKFAGKKGKCNKCGGVVEVPAEAPAGSSGSSGNSAAAAKPAPGNVAPKPAAGKPAAAPTGQAARPQPAQPAGAAGARPVGARPAGAASAGQAKPQGQAGTQPIDLAAALNAAPPPSAAGIKVSGPLDNVLDELTESDFNRSSPYQNVYAPPKPKAEKNAMLEKAAKQEDDDGGGGPKLGKDGRPKLTGTLLVFGVLDILESLVLFAIAIALAFLGFNIPEDIKDKIPFVGAGFAVLIVIIGFLSTVMMASGLGILTKQIWGYCTALSIYSFQLGFRLIALLGSITDVQRIGGPIFGLICMFACTAYFFNDECKRVYDVPKKSKLPLIFGGIGFGVAFMFGLLLFLLGAFASAAASAPQLGP